MTLFLPLSVWLPRKTKPDKKISLNLNVYRNLNPFSLNEAKHRYRDEVEFAYLSQGVRKLPGPPYRFIYTVYPATRRLFDLENVCSIVSKFTCDSLVELGVIPGDDYTVIRSVDYRFGGVDKGARCELLIEGEEGHVNQT